MLLGNPLRLRAGGWNNSFPTPERTHSSPGHKIHLKTPPCWNANIYWLNKSMRWKRVMFSWAPVLKSAWSHLLSQAEWSLMINKTQWGILFQTQLPKGDRNKFLCHFKGFTHLWHQWVLTHQCSISDTNVSLLFLLIFLFLLSTKNIPPV